MDFYLISNDFWHKRKMYNVDPYNVFLAIATNIPQRLQTAFVLQGHVLELFLQRGFGISIFIRKYFF